MTRRQFLATLPLSAGMAGCLSFDPRWTAAPLAAAVWAQSATAFAFDLFGQLRKQPGNLVFSPLCVSTSLALAAAGANGETRDEIDRTLHWSGEPDALHVAVAMLQRQLAAGLAAGGSELRVACGLWADKSLPVTKDFRAIAEKQYGGALQTTEFAKTDVAVTAINNWAELQTAFKVKELLKANAVPPDTNVLLASAGFFKGAWAPGMFPPAVCSYGPFSLADGGKTTAYYLRQSAWARCAQSDNWQALELPHAGGALRMLVLVPSAPGGLPAVESALTAAMFERLQNELKSEYVAVALPRFKFGCDSALAPMLDALGIHRAAQPGDADFSRLAGPATIALRSVVHKAAIEVNGNSGPPALTARGKTSVNPDDPRIVALDRPFLFAVRDAASGSVLMLGRVEKPA